MQVGGWADDMPHDCVDAKGEEGEYILKEGKQVRATSTHRRSESESQSERCLVSGSSCASLSLVVLEAYLPGEARCNFMIRLIQVYCSPCSGVVLFCS